MSRSVRVLLALGLMGYGYAYSGDDSTTPDVIYDLTDEEYYAMPRLFSLDDYMACLAPGGVYCLGSFELVAPLDHHLFQTMKGWSNNWVDNFNHTRLHRGLCVSRHCPHPGNEEPLEAWFESCVNTSTTSAYNISARLYQLEYCRRGITDPPPLTNNQRAFAAVFATLIALAAISTCLDLTLTDHAKEVLGWTLCWSIPRSWRTLTAPSPPTSSADLRCFDGLRVFCMMSVILEHVCWLATLSYIDDTRNMEMIRRQPDVMLMTNSTLVVQIFFVMSSFLLAYKLLKQKSRGPIFTTFLETMINRIIRISPSHLMVIWFASSWWERVNSGPLWTPLVGGEAAVCRKKWWTHLLFINNLVYPDDKCLIPTWYLAADMQLYAASLLFLLLVRGRRTALLLLSGLFVAFTALNFTFAYVWHLIPNFVLHRPESVRASYGGEASFNVLYQSPLGNAPAAIGGLLLALIHREMKDRGVSLSQQKTFRWFCICAAPAAVCWAGLSPLAAGSHLPARLTAAALAALERPVFVLLVLTALLGAINGVKSPWRTWLSHMGAVVPRLSFGALLLHLPLNKALLASRIAPIQLDRSHAIYEWFGVGVIAYTAAIPLALLVEFPALALYRELRRVTVRPTLDPTQEKLDKPEPVPQ
ncbi:unnamed protein product [Pieris macdunnoughi]|uniref:Acyltransferase 3 domain-containing protein n=1 Tax=Pieris macdunnoughi TaxID=345717 RepID=A0A821PEV7_9NEOP|nr:unnamed protein product [Pieris macdunnoughi]